MRWKAIVSILLIAALLMSGIPYQASAADALTVAEAIAAKSDGPRNSVTVEGYIVGHITAVNAYDLERPFNDDGNFVIADSPVERDPGKLLPSELPEPYRSAFGLNSHPENLRQKVRITADLDTYYDWGLVRPSAIEFIAEPGKETITLDKTAITFTGPDQTQQLKLTQNRSDGTKKDITGQTEISTSDTSVVTVDGSGLARSVNTGTATITLVYEEVSYKVSVKVLDGGSAMPVGGGDTVTLAVIPDTQMYSRYSPEVFAAQTQWVADNSEQESIDFTMHLGDIVDRRDEDYEWQNAVTAMDKLTDAKLPHSYLPGNHDINESQYDDNRSDENFLKYLSPADRLANNPGFGGTDPTGFSSYSTFEAAGRTFTVLALDWRVSDATLNWAQSVIDEHPDNPVILTTHELINIGDDFKTAIMTEYGNRLWDKLITKNDQIFLTLNGHFHGAANMVKKNDKGNDVLMIVSDYQGYYNGGDGFMRQMRLDFTNNAIYTKTFSPWVIHHVPVSERTQFDLEEMTDEKNRFVVPMNLKERFPKKTPLDVEGVIAHWQFAEPEDGGDKVADQSGHGNDLVRVDTDGNDEDNPDIYARWSDDTSPLSLSKGSIEMHHSRVEATESTYFRTEDFAPLNGETFPNGYTIEAFVKINDDFTQEKNGWMNIMNRPKGNDGTPYNTGQWPTDDVARLAVSNLKEFQWETYDNGKGDSYSTAWSGENALGQWIHVAAVNDGKTTDLYVDGAHQLRTVTGNPLGIQVARQDGKFTPWLIGKPENSFNGWISEVRITDHALSLNEMLLHTNNAPVSGNLSLTTKMNTPVNGAVQANDADLDLLTYSVVQAPAKGEVKMASDGTFTYTPKRNAYGSDTFTFKANDGKVDSNTATVNIEIVPNIAPEATNSSYQVNINGKLSKKLTAIDNNGDKLTYTVTQPSHGTLTLTDEHQGTFEYVPDADFTGRDSFTFKASDGALESETATVSINVTNLKDHIVSYWKFQDSGDGTYDVKDLTGNGNDMFRVDAGSEDSPDVEIGWDSDRAPYSRSAGSLRMSNDHQADEISYFRTVDDAPVNAMTFEEGYTIEAIVKIPSQFDADKHGNAGLLSRGVTGAAGGKTEDDPQRAIAGLNLTNLKELQWSAYPTDQDNVKIAQSPEITTTNWMHIALVNDAETTTMYIDGSPQVTVAEDAKGIATAMADGKFAPWIVGTTLYGSDWMNGFNGSISEIRLTDVALDESEFLLTNEAPQVADLSLTTTVGQAVYGQLQGEDPDLDPLQFIISSDPSHGKVAITDESEGMFVYTPEQDFTGTDSFEYVVTDGIVTTDPATVRVHVGTDSVILSSLSLSKGKLSPAFAPEITSYTAVVPYEVKNITVTASVKNSVTASVYNNVTDSVYHNVTDSVTVITVNGITVPNGAESEPIDLEVGRNAIEVVVTNGTVTQDYNVVVTRKDADAPVPGKVELTGLTLSNGTLSPAFDPSVTSYSSSVANGVTNVTVTASVYDADSTVITVNDVPVANGQESGPIALKVGQNQVKVVVEALDGAPSKTYNVTIARRTSGNSGGGSSGGGGGNGGGSNGGSGSGGGTKVTQPAKPESDSSMKDGILHLTLNWDEISKQANSGNAIVYEVADSEQAYTGLTVDISREFFLSGKDLTLKSALGDITIPSGVLEPDSSAHAVSLNFITGQRPSVQSDSLVPVSGLYDFKINVDGNQVHAFGKPVVITFAYDQADTDPNKVAVYYYNPATESWKYAGGDITGDGKIKYTVATGQFSQYAVMAYTQTFADTLNHWARADIEWLGMRQIINGVTKSSFVPDQEVTRAEFAAILVKALDLDSSSTNHMFSDVSIDSWYADSIGALYESGIIQGTGTNRFNPNGTIRREEIAAMIVRAQSFHEGEAAVKENTSGDKAFADAEDISAWAIPYVVKANEMKWLQGYPDNKFLPKATATRAEIAAVTHRFLE
ncbi:Ig-like domain-containing protein [Paenibacillus jiagnxiensis]|uniref:Ig-like domain-containing protein n=1 Tax=Paenibacillus jiagnxiensis TaxID=3228926 RepID=UPI0038D35971